MPRHRGLLRRKEGVLALASLASVVLNLELGVAHAAPATKSGRQGLALAKSGDCVAAVPLLERAEAEDHLPSTASALAGCHLALGEVVLAYEIFHALAEERASPAWDAADKKAHGEAPKKAADLEVRIPKVNLAFQEDAPGLVVTVAGRAVADPSKPVLVPPDEKVLLRVTADGREPFELSLVMAEREQKTVRVDLVRKPDGGGGGGAGGGDVEPPSVTPPNGQSTMWLGGRFRGVLLPKFFMNLAGEGGRTTYLPGGDFTFTVRTGDVELVPAIGVASLGLGPTPFKPADTPDTEWEIVESDLFALTLTLDVAWVIPLDDAGLVALRLGGSVGLGWALAGDLYRTQAYPSDGEPGDPYSYEKCAGPNDPAGSFRYCNQLDKDADRYGQPDDPWGDGGARPIIYPWLVLPQIGLSFYPDDQFAIDVSVGTSLMGLVTDVGFRIGL